MSDSSQVLLFLKGLGHLVVTAEQYATPTNPDEFYTAIQVREDASALIDFTMEKLMFLGQRLGKLPPLPDIATLQHKDGWDEHMAYVIAREGEPDPKVYPVDEKGNW